MTSPEEQGGPRRGKLRQTSATLAAFAMYSLRRFLADGCFSASGALSYTTLVSLVPLAVIAFGTLSAFPIFAQVHDELVALVFRTLVPSIGEQAAWWFRAFADSAAQTTAIGIAGISATGILLLVTVEDQLNLIWRVTSPRPWVQRILAYWTLITLGPLLIGISLSLSTYFELAARQVGLGQEAVAWFASSWLHSLARAVPAVLEFVALHAALLPHPELRGALARRRARRADRNGRDRNPEGWVFDSISAPRRFIRRCMARSPSSRSFCCGCTYHGWRSCSARWSPPHCRTGGSTSGSARYPSGGVRLGFSLSLIASLARAQRRGESRSTPALAAELGVATTVIDEHLRPLAEAGFVAHTQEGCWVLSWAPETATLHDLYEALHLPLAGRWMGRAAQPWQRQVAPAMDRIVKAESAAMGVTIASLLAETLDPVPAGAAAGARPSRCPKR